MRTNIKMLQVTRAAADNAVLLSGKASALLVVQDQVCGAKALVPIAGLLNAQNPRLRRECLATLRIVIQGGNNLAQDSFALDFSLSREDTFFADVKRLIETSMESISEIRQLQADREAARQDIEGLKSSMQGSIRGMSVGDSNWMSDPDLVAVTEEGAYTGSAESQASLSQVLQVLQALCEGNNTALQNYLREQPDNLTTVNLVALATEGLGVLVQELDSGSMNNICNALETLVQMSQGNTGNQRAIFDHRAVDYVNLLLRSRVRCPRARFSRAPP